MSQWDDLCFEEEKKISYGLDYGTSRSLFAFKEEGRPPEAVVPESQTCRNGIPSLFWYRKEPLEPSSDRILLCDEVVIYNGEVEDPEGVAASVKMRLYEDDIILHGNAFPVEEILFQQMLRIYNISKEEFSFRGIEEDIQILVVGTPVRAGAYEKAKTMRAAQRLLPNAKIMLLPEPYAAALYVNSISRSPLETALVFDFGAGTFDTCVLVPNNRITPDDPYPYKSLAADGLNKAGDVLDELMEELILKKLKEMPNKINIRVLENRQHHDRRALRVIARNTKERLSDALSATVVITGTECGTATVVIQRQEYEDVIRPVISEAVALAAAKLHDADKWEDPNMTILMVGGSSYIPLVKTLLQETFSWLKPNQFIRRFPDQAIALGCALFAEKPLVERKVTYGYAVDTYLFGTDNLILDVRIPANCSLPYTTKASYITRFENQTGIRFDLYEVPDAQKGEHLPLDAGTMKQFFLTHQFGRAVKKGTPIELTTTLDENGVLTLKTDDFGISEQRTTECTLNLSKQTG